MSDIVRRAYFKHIVEKYVSKRRQDVYYVHELCMCYQKAMFYRMLQGYNVIDIGNINDRMIIGELIHEGMIRVLKHEECIEPEEKCKQINDITICGTADLICNNIVIEIKYVSKSEKIINNGNITPMEHHVDQCRLYGWLYDVEKCVLIYVTPSRIVHVMFEPFSDYEVRQIVNNWFSDRPSPKYEWECKYCPFRNMCPVAVR